MSKYCPHCGMEHGMAFGTGDCGCESDREIGFTLDASKGHAERMRSICSYDEQRKKQKRLKAIIELEGRGAEGLNEAENMLMMAGYPPLNGEKSGEYFDNILDVKVSWRIIEL